MYLLLSIVISVIIGFLLVMMGSFFGGVVAFGLVLGCLFRGVYLLNEIHKKIVPNKDKVQVAYEEYLANSEKTS